MNDLGHVEPIVDQHLGFGPDEVTVRRAVFGLKLFAEAAATIAARRAIRAGRRRITTQHLGGAVFEAFVLQQLRRPNHEGNAGAVMLALDATDLRALFGEPPALEAFLDPAQLGEQKIHTSRR